MAVSNTWLLCSIIQTCSKDIQNGAVANGCVHQKNSDKVKPSSNGDICNGTVKMNGVTHSDAQLRQRHKETASHNSGSDETVTESGKIEIGFLQFLIL